MVGTVELTHHSHSPEGFPSIELHWHVLSETQITPGFTVIDGIIRKQPWMWESDRPLKNMQIEIKGFDRWVAIAHAERKIKKKRTL